MGDYEHDQTMDGQPIPRAKRNPPRVLPAGEAIRRMGREGRDKPPHPVDRSGEWDQRPADDDPAA